MTQHHSEHSRWAADRQKDSGDTPGRAPVEPLTAEWFHERLCPGTWPHAYPDAARCIAIANDAARADAARQPAEADILMLTAWPGYERHQHADGSWCQRKVDAARQPAIERVQLAANHLSAGEDAAALAILDAVLRDAARQPAEPYRYWYNTGWQAGYGVGRRGEHPQPADIDWHAAYDALVTDTLAVARQPADPAEPRGRQTYGHGCDWPGCRGECHTDETCPCHPVSQPAAEPRNRGEGLREALKRLRDHGYQPMYNGRPSCPFCLRFVDSEETHAPSCVLVAALTDDSSRAWPGGPRNADDPISGVSEP